MRVSSRGNPNHDERGRFCSAGQVAVTSEKTEEQYEAHTQNRIVQSECAFSPKKTIREAEEFVRSLGVTPHFNGFSLQQCNTVCKALHETFVEFPKTRKFIKHIGTTDSWLRFQAEKDRKQLELSYVGKGLGEKTASKLADIECSVMSRLMGSSCVCTLPNDYQEGGIYINAKSSDGEQGLKDRIIGLGTYGGNKFTANTYHEFGHMIAFAYSPDEGKAFAAQFKKGEIRFGLSAYASSNHSELMAEGWAELKTSKKPRKIALAVGGYLRGLKNE